MLLIFLVATLKKRKEGIFLVVQWLRFGTFTSGAQVQYLVRELRSYKPHGMWLEKKKKKQCKKKRQCKKNLVKLILKSFIKPNLCNPLYNNIFYPTQYLTLTYWLLYEINLEVFMCYFVFFPHTVFEVQGAFYPYSTFFFFSMIVP